MQDVQVDSDSEAVGGMRAFGALETVLQSGLRDELLQTAVVLQDLAVLDQAIK